MSLMHIALQLQHQLDQQEPYIMMGRAEMPEQDLLAKALYSNHQAAA